MSAEKTISTHQARTAMNREPEVRAWAENWLMEKERAIFMAQPGAAADEFERHWRYVRPERVHEGAVEAVAAYYAERELKG